MYCQLVVVLCLLITVLHSTSALPRQISRVPFEDECIYVCDRAADRVYQVDTATGVYRSLYNTTLGRPEGVAYDSVVHDVYMVDHGDVGVLKHNLWTGQEQSIYSPGPHTLSATVDEVDRKIYFTTGSTIRQVDLVTHQHQTFVSGGGNKYGVVVDSKQREIYWSESSAIKRASLDDVTNPTTLISTSINSPTALAADFEAGIMYWGDSSLDKIESCNLDGTGRQVIATEPGTAYTGFALSANFLYFTDSTKTCARKMDRITYTIVDQPPCIITQAWAITIGRPANTSFPTTTMQTTTDVDECTSSPCQNGATCINDNNGYRCTCPPGYTGTNCEIDVDECASSPCRNGATCINDFNGYRCNCAPGYTGTNCEIDVDECASSPCRNGATCINDFNGYRCTCPPGYTGTNCEIGESSGNCGDLSGLWDSVSPKATLCIEVNTTNQGLTVGLSRSGNDPFWMEVIGRTIVGNYIHLGLSWVRPYGMGVVGFAGECQRCVNGVELLYAHMVSRNNTVAEICNNGGSADYSDMYTFTRTLTGVCRDANMKVWKPGMTN